jgi:predicted acetyltransferase
MLLFFQPSVVYKKIYLEMMNAWKASGEAPMPWVLTLDYANFPALCRALTDFSVGKGLPSGFTIPCTTFWAYDTDAAKLVGALNIRHELNDDLLNYHGHIGYGVRPDMRRKGYATRMLAMAKKECRRLDIARALVCCNSENTASARVIEKNGGVLEDERILPENGKTMRRYWIDV